MRQLNSQCSPVRLDAFLSGDLDDHGEKELITHLDECTTCREDLESRAADAASWREAGELLQGHADELGTSKLPHQIRNVLDALAPTDHPDMMGRFAGYEISGVVGAGSMGVVLKGFDQSLDRPVSIKVLAAHLASSGAARARFAREAKAAAAVLHPNVMAIHSVSTDGPFPYLVMPYIRGCSLQKRIDDQGSLATSEILRICSQMSAGLAAAHAQGLVHRDIQPANILLEDGVERVSITDFGLARAVDDATMRCTGFIAGTPQYMSPEQARGEMIDQRSDLFSLGSVLYAMCTGRPPFRADTSYGVMRKISDNLPTPIREINPEVPTWLCGIIARLMAKPLSERIASAAEASVLLSECLAHHQHPTSLPLPSEARHAARLVDSEPKVKATKPVLQKSGSHWGIVAIFFALVIAASMIIIELDKGKITISSDVGEVPVKIMKGNTVVKELSVGQTANGIRIASGEYVVVIDGKHDGFTVANGNVTLLRGKEAIVKIIVKPQPTPKAKDLSKREQLLAKQLLSAIQRSARAPAPEDLVQDLFKIASIETNVTTMLDQPATRLRILEACLDAYSKLAKTHPNHKRLAELRLAQARCLMQLGRYEEARHVLQQLLIRHPKTPDAKEAKKLLQRVTLDLGVYDEVLADVMDLDAYFQLANRELRKRRPDLKLRFEANDFVEARSTDDGRVLVRFQTSKELPYATVIIEVLPNKTARFRQGTFTTKSKEVEFWGPIEKRSNSREKQLPEDEFRSDGSPSKQPDSKKSTERRLINKSPEK